MKKENMSPPAETWLGSSALSQSVIAPDPEDQEKNTSLNKDRSHFLSKKIIGSSLAILVVFISIWSICAMNLRHIDINGTKLSANTSKTELISKIDDVLAGYKIKLVYPDKTIKNYGLSDVGLTLNTPATINSIDSLKNSLGSYIKWWQPIKAKVIFNENKQTYLSFINSKTTIMVHPPLNASLSLNGANIDLSNAIVGSEYGLSPSDNSLYNIAANLSPAPIKLTTITVNPSVTAKQLVPYKEEIEKIISQPINISIAGQSFKPSTSEIASWLEISPTNNKVNIAVDNAKISSYISSITGPLSHPPVAQVDNSTDNNQIIVPGQNGVSISNTNSTVSTIASNLINASGISTTLPATSTPYETISTGSYPKWIEVDITNKRLYAYQFGTLIMTYLVTAGAPLTPTVTGQYAIYSKFVSQSMYGENVDGSSYYQPNVPYVNYFYKDYAIHGNYWRPLSYFGNVNSSHGCVGLMVPDSEWVYNWAPIGTPVVIHT